MTAPPDTTLSGRPVATLTFAIDHAIWGGSLPGYHATNLVIHLLAGLTLFGLAWRTLARPPLQERLGGYAVAIAFVIAGIWTLHPLQTESVTYVVQRAESLAGLWLLLTLYAALRGAATSRPGHWHALALGCCLLGMATKEIMFAAPLVVWLHDRTFATGTFTTALQRRPAFYAALFSTWIVLGWLVWRTGNRGATAGFGLGISPWHYLLTSCAAIVHYVRLTFWPVPLVLDYGFAVTTDPTAVWPQALAVLSFALATAVAIVQRSSWGFCGAWFFLLLAPSSSLVPVATQTPTGATPSPTPDAPPRPSGPTRPRSASIRRTSTPGKISASCS